MCFFDAVSPVQMVILGTIIAIAISQDQSADALNVIGNFLIGVGGLIVVWASQLQYQQAKEENSTRKNELQQQMEQLQRQLEKLGREQRRLQA